MRRTVTMAALLLLGALSFGLYLMENEVEKVRRQRAELDRQLLDEQKNMQVLKAEWSYLNQPERLQELAAGYADRLALRPVAPSQIGRLSDLPMRPAETEGGAESGGAGMVSLPRPAFKPTPPPGVLFASSGAGQ